MRLHETYEGQDVPKRTKWIYTTIACTRDAAYTLVAMFLITYIQYSGILTKGLTEASASEQNAAFVAMFGVISALVIGYRIFDALNDPFMGVIIEKVHFKSGKYKPWILLGGWTNAITVLALFVGPSIIPGLSGWAYVAWFAVFYLLWGMTFTMNDIAYWGMLPSLTSEEKQRTSITTIMSIFCSLGQFAIAGLAPVLSGSFGYNVYTIIAIVVVILFVAGQTIAYFGIKEHKRDLEAEAKQEPPHFKDMFNVVKKNDQVRIMTVILFIYYLGSGILNALGLNYFYFAVNYTVGSSIMTIFTIIYGLGVILAQFLFPVLSQKFTRKQLINFSIICCVVGYIAFFVYGLPLGDGNYLSANPVSDGGINMLYLIPLCLIGLLIFFSQGLFYLILIIMMTNTIEYNEWKFGERKEAVIFSLRPLTTKFASAIQQGVLYLFLIFASLTTVITQISDLQTQLVLGEITSDVVGTSADVLVAAVEPSQVLIFKLGVAILPMVLFVVCYILIKKFYKIDEETYAKICNEIKARQESTATEKVEE